MTYFFTNHLTSSFNRAFSRKAIETPPWQLGGTPLPPPAFNRAFSRKAIETSLEFRLASPVSAWLSIEHSAERQLRHSIIAAQHFGERLLSIEHSAERQLRRDHLEHAVPESGSAFNRAFSRKAIETGPQTFLRSHGLSWSFNRAFSRKAIETPLARAGGEQPLVRRLSIEHSAERQLRPVEELRPDEFKSVAFNRAFSRKAIETRHDVRS